MILTLVILGRNKTFTVPRVCNATGKP